MPKLTRKNLDPAKHRPVKEVPVLPEKRRVVVEKLKEEIYTAKTCKDQATKQKSHFERKLHSVPGYQTETMFGSEISQFLTPRNQDKYHLTRWEFALRTVNRRMHRLNKLLKAKIKGYE